MNQRSTHLIVYTCFFLSGVAGLIYQVVWARQLALFLGITTHAHTTVITAFMVGLAAGAWCIGRSIDHRRDILQLYAWLEIGIGVYACLTPWMLSALQGVYAMTAEHLEPANSVAHGLRFSIALAALLIPTFLMGGTLPLLIKGLASGLHDFGSHTARLYGINTLGAACGACTAGYVLLPALGMRNAIFASAALNFIIAAAILLIDRQRHTTSKAKDGPRGAAPFHATERAATPQISSTTATVLLVGFAVSGFAALVYEIAWIRALTLVIGSSVYAFSATLGTYLSGIAVGSLVCARFLARGGVGDHVDRRLGLAAILEVLTGVAALIGLVLIGRLPGLFLWGVEIGLHENFALFQLFIFGMCFLIMLPPTLFLGALFPLITALWTHDATAFGRSVGTAYAVNTGGTILGALLGGLLLLHSLGVHASVVLASALHVMVGIAFHAARGGPPKLARRSIEAIATLAMFALLAVSLPPWDRALMTSGVFYHPKGILKKLSGKKSLLDFAKEAEILYYAEGVDGTVAVKRDGDELILVINGKSDASSIGDLPTQVLLAQIPLLMHAKPTNVLIIGLGSGITAGSVATHRSVERIAIVEISREVVAASQFFAAQHGDVLDDDRTQLIVADARNHLLAQPETYDVIISEPSNPWITGISNLFTQEAFELSKTRLAPGGILAQWFHVYNMAPADLKSVMATFRSVFPHVTVWIPSPGDLILVGSINRHALDFARLVEAFAQHAIREDLERIDTASITRLVETYLMGGAELDRFTVGAALNTDDQPRIEFNAPRNLYVPTDVRNMRELTQHADEGLVPAPIDGMALATSTGLDAPALGLSIRTAAQPTEGNWQTQWLVTWKVLSDETAEVPEASVNSLRLAAWIEEGTEFRVFGDVLATSPTDAEQRTHLRNNLGGQLTDVGTVRMPCGEPGLWGVSTESGSIKLGIVWHTQLRGQSIRYVAYRQVRDTTVGGVEAILSDLSDRFHCRNP